MTNDERAMQKAFEALFASVDPGERQELADAIAEELAADRRSQRSFAAERFMAALMETPR